VDIEKMMDQEVLNGIRFGLLLTIVAPCLRAHN